MIDSLSTVTSSVVSVALDALSQRQQLIATNLANANSTGYVPQYMEFESALKQAIEEAASLSGTDAQQVLAELRQRIGGGDYVVEAGTGAASSGVQIDLEMVRLNETVLQYQALIQGMGKYGSLARMAVSGDVK